jgi:hypothetical protein
VSPKTLDTSVFVPLIPAVPVLVTWVLRWERWIPRFIPKSVIGPYLLYGAFAAWYFKMPWWFVALVGVWGVGVTVWGVGGVGRGVRVDCTLGLRHGVKGVVAVR